MCNVCKELSKKLLSFLLPFFLEMLIVAQLFKKLQACMESDSRFIVSFRKVCCWNILLFI
jgi:hypothetical protein